MVLENKTSGYVMRMPYIKIAHRGFSDKYIDNTLEAFQGAIDTGFDMIELDIQACICGTLVVYHDINIGSSFFRNTTYEKMCEKNDGEILTLETFYSSIFSTDIKIYLDLKGSVKTIESIILFYKNSPQYINDNLYIASFNRKYLKTLHIVFPQIKLGFITASVYTNEESIQLFKDFHFIAIDWTMLSLSLVDLCHKMNVKVFVYTSKSKIEENYIKKYMVDGIVSNIIIS
jgi:glycerophosphoryl diester phosphodiesterase